MSTTILVNDIGYVANFHLGIKPRFTVGKRLVMSIINNINDMYKRTENYKQLKSSGKTVHKDFHHHHCKLITTMNVSLIMMTACLHSNWIKTNCPSLSAIHRKLPSDLFNTANIKIFNCLVIPQQTANHENLDFIKALKSTTDSVIRFYNLSSTDKYLFIYYL